MWFYQPKIIRYYCRYLLVGIMIILPLFLLILSLDKHFTSPDEIIYPIIILSFLTIFNFIVIQVGLWENMFSKIYISENEIIWKCPLRTTRQMLVAECVEIGGFLRYKDNGIPIETIYFSKTKITNISTAAKNLRRNRNIIVFRYSEALYTHIKKSVANEKTRRLIAYRVQRKASL